MNDVTGKVAFITGGASGIGFGMAQAFAAAGMKVALADVDDQGLDRAASDFAKTNATIVTVRLDVTDRGAWASALDRVESALGPVDLLCNNAGIGGAGGLMETIDPEAFDRVIAVNLTGVHNGIAAIVPRLKARRAGGHIVNTASMAGLLGTPGLGGYVASKFAVVGMSEVLRRELEPFGIGVSVLCPGFVRTAIAESVVERDAGTVPSAGAGMGGQLVEIVRQAVDNGADPRKVGEFVLQGIRENRFYLLTHAEYRDIVAARFAAVSEQFGTSADPDKRDMVALLAGGQG